MWHTEQISGCLENLGNISSYWLGDNGSPSYQIIFWGFGVSLEKHIQLSVTPHSASYLRSIVLCYACLDAPHCLCSETLTWRYSNKKVMLTLERAFPGINVNNHYSATTIENYYLYSDSHQSLENILWHLVITIEDVKIFKKKRKKEDPLNWVLLFSGQW